MLAMPAHATAGAPTVPTPDGDRTVVTVLADDHAEMTAPYACPTGEALVAFSDSWGAPRSGGRRHEGVDVIGHRGAPILAVVDGFAKAKSNTLGGTAVWLVGDDGNRYYYAHLDSHGTLGAVTKGSVIGYMGDTGNAKASVVHLHFGAFVDDDTPANPYPLVADWCGRR